MDGNLFVSQSRNAAFSRGASLAVQRNLLHVGDLLRMVEDFSMQQRFWLWLSEVHKMVPGLPVSVLVELLSIHDD